MKAALFNLLVLLSAALAAAGTQQQQQQQQQQQVPQCTWFAYDPKIPVAGYCTLDDRVLLASTSLEPTSFISKQLMRIYGRQYLCNSNGNKGKAACEAYEAKERLGCYWSDGINMCQARDMTDWKWFSRHAYASETPVSFLCPGSRAALHKICFSLKKGAQCTATKGCVPAAGEDGGCEPDFWGNLKATNMTSQWSDQFQQANPIVMGACEATCYLRGLYSRKTGIYGSDAWGKALDAAAKDCSALSKDSFTCRAGPKVGVVSTARIDKFKNYVVDVPAAAKAGQGLAFACPY